MSIWPQAARYGELRPLAPFFAPDVVLHQAESLPYGGIWRGHDGMERFFAAMSQAWEEFEMVEQEFLATSGTAVVLTQVHARARATGRELDFPILQTIRVSTGESPKCGRSTGTPRRSPRPAVPRGWSGCTAQGGRSATR